MRMQALGLTAADITKATGVSKGTVSFWVNGINGAKGKNLLALAKALRCSPDWLSDGVGHAPTDGSNVVLGPPVTSPSRRIAIIGTAQMGAEGHWFALDEAGGWVESWTRDEDAYALELRGDSMSPAIRNGWIAICEPNHRLVPGEYVMVTTVDGESMVKELLFQSETDVSLMSLNAAYERRTIPWTKIETIHYVAAIMGPSRIQGRI